MMASAVNDPRRAGVIWAVNLDEPMPAVVPLIPVHFSCIGPDSVDALAEAGGAKDEIVNRFEAGKRCYAAWVGQQVAAYGWVSLDNEFIGEFNLCVHLLPGEAYIWDCLTVPVYRRQGLYSALLIYIRQELQRDGLCRAWIGADLDNSGSQRGIAHAGFHAIADMVLARVLAMRLVWVQGRDGVHPGAVAEARRAFLDNRDTVWLKAFELVRNTSQPAYQASQNAPPSATGSPDSSHQDLSAADKT